MIEHKAGSGEWGAGHLRWLAVGLLGALSLSQVSCGNAGEDLVTSIEAAGSLTGTVFFDGNGTGDQDATDVPLAGVDISLVLAGTADTVQSATSDQDGTFGFVDVPVGSYGLVVDTSTIGDSTIVSAINPPSRDVARDDTVNVDVAISFPKVSTTQARGLPIGTNVFIDGIALNDVLTFGDSTVHVADTAGSIRAVRSGLGDLSAADSVRLRGKIATRSGQTVIDLDRQNPFVLALAEVPAPDTVTTAEAANADGDLLDAALVRVDSAHIVDTSTVSGNLVATVTDGTGPLEVVFDEDIVFNLGSYLVPGADLRCTGVLVPTSLGDWQLKPRFDLDVEILAPIISIAEARTRPLGSTVFVEGVALNSWGWFGADPGGGSTVHLADTSAAIRATNVATSVTLRDSIGVIGTIDLVDGQPVIVNPTIVPLSQLVLNRLPRGIATGNVPDALGGTQDAALVRVLNATIQSTSIIGGDRHYTVDDGTGSATVVIDVDLPVQNPPFDFSTWTVGARMTATGLLVPTGGGIWVLKPRLLEPLIDQPGPLPADVTVQP
jgi:hypothetical protein